MRELEREILPIPVEELNEISPSEIDAIVKKFDAESDENLTELDKIDATQDDPSTVQQDTWVNGGYGRDPFVEHRALNVGGQVLMVSKSASIGKALETGKARPVISANSKIGDSCKIEADFIGNSSVIGDEVTIGKKSKIGVLGTAKNWENPGVTIGPNAEVAMGVTVKPNTKVGDKAKIGPGSIIGFHQTQKEQRRGVVTTATKKSGRSPKDDKAKKTGIRKTPRTTIGEGVILGRGVKVEAGATIPSGYIVPDGLVIPRKLKLPLLQEGESKTLSNRIIEDLIFSVKHQK